MPELPEVQTIIDDLKNRILRREIRGIKTLTKSIWLNKIPRKEKILGAAIDDISRRGKYIIIYLANNTAIIIHLGMTGQLLLLNPKTKPAKHTHVVIALGKFDLHFNDIRRFGFIDIVDAENLDDIPYLSKLGPDPLQISKGDFAEIISSKSRMIKPLMLDQSVISGFGNIYSDEILFEARINPRAISSGITKRKLTIFHAASQKVLKNALKARGSSVSNYVDGSGERGSYQNSHLVYGKEGKPCVRCGSKIKRETIGSRSAHFCPRCQKL